MFDNWISCVTWEPWDDRWHRYEHERVVRCRMETWSFVRQQRHIFSQTIWSRTKFFENQDIWQLGLDYIVEIMEWDFHEGFYFAFSWITHSGRNQLLHHVNTQVEAQRQRSWGLQPATSNRRVSDFHEIGGLANTSYRLLPNTAWAQTIQFSCSWFLGP